MSADLVTGHIRRTASDLGVVEKWRELEKEIGEVSTLQDTRVEIAVDRYKHPRLLEESKDEPNPSQ